MDNEKDRDPIFEPMWFKNETRALANQWRISNSKLDIVDYILKYASKEYKELYASFEQAS